MENIDERLTNHNTFVLERNYAAPVERVFTALADPAQKRRWFAGPGLDVEAYELDFRVGGRERLRSRFQPGTPLEGKTVTHEAAFCDIVPNRRVVTAATMSIGEHRISASLVTFELLPAAKGTTLILTHQAVFFEGSDGPERREEGWRKLLDRLDRALADE